MEHRWAFVAVLCCLARAAAAAGSAPAEPAAPAAEIGAPRDVEFPGVFEVSVDATDLDHRLLKVHETIPAPPGGHLVLLYPKWIPGAHAPAGPLDRLAGLIARAGGTRIEWERDPVDVWAFHLNLPAGVGAVDLDFQYLSAVTRDVGPPEMTASLLALDWSSTVLYPAGYFARRIPVDARLTLPEEWSFATALETASTDGRVTTFRRVSLETLIDSPVRAGRYLRRYDLAPGDATPVHMDLVAEREDLLEVKTPILDGLRELVQQAYKLFGSHHYDHYDMLVSLSDAIGEDTTLEHHRSAEYGEPASLFLDWDRTVIDKDVLAHEFAHSWNGKFRRPADLWTPNYDVPMRNSLLWVYEGQTQYWGEVLTARAGLWSREQALDVLAMTIASLESARGRSWRALQDTTADEIINARRPLSWPTWQRFEDYYEEGLLVWLDADTLIRERSRGRRSLDDFARAFFGVENGSYTPLLYTFDDVVKALNDVEPYDWAAFLKTRLEGHADGPPLDGVRRGGYTLVVDDTPNELAGVQAPRVKGADFTLSLGLTVDRDGALTQVAWDSPAFRAGLAPGMRLVAVNDVAFDVERLREAVTLAKGQGPPVGLLIRDGDRFHTVRIDYHDGLRYLHLERDPSRPPLLDEILSRRR